MTDPLTTMLRKIGSSWVIELPDAFVRALRWTDQQAVHVHAELSDGLWLSSTDDSASMAELVAFAESRGHG